MSRRLLLRTLIAAVAVLALAIALQGLRRPGGMEVQVKSATRADLSVPILCDGTLEPPPGGEVRAREAATVSAILAREGERVGRGTPLLTLGNPQLVTAAHEARSLALQLQGERERAAVEVAQTRREAALAARTLEADERLLAEGAIPKAAREASELAARAAAERLRLAEQRLDGLARRGGRLALAEASASELEARTATLTVGAPAEGVVYNLPRAVGEMVAAGQVVAAVADPGRLRVRARVDQPDLPRVAAGQRLVVTFDGLPGSRWEGRVTVVSPGLREVAGREVGEVLGEIAPRAGTPLPPNAAVNVQIVVGEKAGALVIPRAALFRDGEARHVFTVKDGRAVKRAVELGLVGVNEVEVVKGLADGEPVALPGMTPLVDGARVVVRPGS